MNCGDWRNRSKPGGARRSMVSPNVTIKGILNSYHSAALPQGGAARIACPTILGFSTTGIVLGTALAEPGLRLFVLASRYSHRSVTTGSTCTARRAGTQLANNATAPMKHDNPMNVTGSNTLTPYSMSGFPGNTSIDR